MKKTLEEKLQMCKEHVEEGKSLSHICELHNSKNLDDLKYKSTPFNWNLL